MAHRFLIAILVLVALVGFQPALAGERAGPPYYESWTYTSCNDHPTVFLVYLQGASCTHNSNVDVDGSLDASATARAPSFPVKGNAFTAVGVVARHDLQTAATRISFSISVRIHRARAAMDGLGYAMAYLHLRVRQPGCEEEDDCGGLDGYRLAFAEDLESADELNETTIILRATIGDSSGELPPGTYWISVMAHASAEIGGHAFVGTGVAGEDLTFPGWGTSETEIDAELTEILIDTA